MRKIALSMAVAGACLMSQECAADPALTTIGNFAVSVEKDPFGDGNKVIAMTGSDAGAMGLRCIENTLSVVVAHGSENWQEGDKIEVKFRADSKEITFFDGIAMGKTVAELENSDAILDQLVGAKTASFRISGPDNTYTFTLQLRQVDKVVAEVKKGCGK